MEGPSEKLAGEFFTIPPDAYLPFLHPKPVAPIITNPLSPIITNRVGPSE